MTRAECKQVSDELKAVLAKYGLEATVRGRFGDTGCKFTIEAEQTTAEAKAKIDNRENVLIGIYLAKQGIHNVGEGGFIGRQVKAIDGKMYTIVGYNSRAQKYPIELKGHNGTKGFKASAKQIIWK